MKKLRAVGGKRERLRCGLLTQWISTVLHRMQWISTVRLLVDIVLILDQQVAQASGQGAAHPATTRLVCSVSKTKLLNGLEVCVYTLSPGITQ